MATVETKVLKVEERDQIGSGPNQRLRKSGRVPAVVYSDGKPSTMLSLDNHEYTLTVRGCKPTQLFKFESQNSALDGKMVLIKAVQMEPIKSQVLHIDFIGIEAGRVLTVTVQVELVGESLAVKENTAFLNQTVYETDVECLPDAIPSSVPLDITGLKEGDSLHASDVKLPEGVRLRSLPALTIVSALSKKAMEAEAVASEAAVAAAKAASAPAAAATDAAAAAPAAGAAVPGADKTGQNEKKK